MAGPIEIVVADDEDGLRIAVAEYLGRHGFAVRAVPDADGVRAALAERPADLLLLDISMPGEDGLSLARSIRGGDHAQIGIIMLSAAGDVVDRVVGLEIGADDYVPKPFDPRELLARMRAVLRRREVARVAPAPTSPVVATVEPVGKVVRMGRNLLDLESRRLTGPDGIEIALQVSEFELLRSFAERPGRPLSRETLLELAHPRGEDHFDRSIDVRIARIRRKIEAVPDRPDVIKTVRGVGYVFDPKAEA